MFYSVVFVFSYFCLKIKYDKLLTAALTLNLLPTLIKLSLPAFCLESLAVLEFSNNARTNLSFDSHTKLSKDMWRASLFFSTNRACGHTEMHTFMLRQTYAYVQSVKTDVKCLDPLSFS